MALCYAAYVPEFPLSAMGRLTWTRGGADRLLRDSGFVVHRENVFLMFQPCRSGQQLYECRKRIEMGLSLG